MPVTINGTTGITTPAENTSALTVGAITGILKATSVVVSQAVAGTDYLNSSTGLQTSSFTGSNQSLSANGYQKIPGGLIIQWGSGIASSSGSTFTFPIAFPTACRSINVTDGTTSSFSGVSVGSLTTTTFFATSTDSQLVYWIAVGY
jgi:hypothetical protein